MQNLRDQLLKTGLITKGQKQQVEQDKRRERKQLKKGLDQLSQEGAIQVFRQRGLLDKDPIVGAVGMLQFDVLKARLQIEYSVEISLSSMPYQIARWVDGPPEAIAKLERGELGILVEDKLGRPVLLCRDEWSLSHLMGRHAAVHFSEEASG